MFYLLETILEAAGHVAEDLGLPHHLADHLLLAFEVVVVELLVHLGRVAVTGRTGGQVIGWPGPGDEEARARG